MGAGLYREAGLPVRRRKRNASGCSSASRCPTSLHIARSSRN